MKKIKTVAICKAIEITEKHTLLKNLANLQNQMMTLSKTLKISKIVLMGMMLVYFIPVCGQGKISKHKVNDSVEVRTTIDSIRKEILVQMRLNNELHGFTYRLTFEGSLIFLKSFKNGKLDGEVIQWHTNGVKKSESFFEKGVEVGTWREWYPNGVLKRKGDYESYFGENKRQSNNECTCGIEDVEVDCEKNDCEFIALGTITYINPKNGKWYYYDMEGRLIRINYFKNGNIERFEQF